MVNHFEKRKGTKAGKLSSDGPSALLVGNFIFFIHLKCIKIFQLQFVVYKTQSSVLIYAYYV